MNSCGLLVPGLRQRLGRNGRAYAEAHFTKARVLQNYERLFAALGFPVAERVRAAGHAADEVCHPISRNSRAV